MPASGVSVGLIAHQVAPVSEAPAGKQPRLPRRLRRLHPVRKLARRRRLRRARKPARRLHRRAKPRAVVRFSDGARRAMRVLRRPHRALQHPRRLRPRVPVAARFSAGVFRGRSGRNLRATLAANQHRWEASSARLASATNPQGSRRRSRHRSSHLETRSSPLVAARCRVRQHPMAVSALRSHVSDIPIRRISSRRQALRCRAGRSLARHNGPAPVDR